MQGKLKLGDSPLDLAKEALLAVIDGPNPASWKPWGRSFSELSKEVDKAELNLPPSYQNLSGYRLRLLLESSADLERRETWNRVVGAIVDGRVPHEDAVVDAFDLLCSRLQLTKSAWFRRYGFHLVVVLPVDATDDHRKFWLHLKLKATDLLGDLVRVRLVKQEGEICYVVPELNRDLILALVKELRSSGLKDAAG